MIAPLLTASCIVLSSQNNAIHTISDHSRYTSIFNTDTITLPDAHRIIEALDDTNDTYPALVNEIMRALYVAEAQRLWERLSTRYISPPEHRYRDNVYTWSRNIISTISSDRDRILSIKESLELSFEELGIDEVLFYSLGMPEVDM